MIRITITHIRRDGPATVTETIVDEYLGSIEGLAARLIACRAALDPSPADELVSPALARRLAELPASLSTPPATVDSMDTLDTDNHAPVIATPERFTVSTEARDVPWTGKIHFARAKTTPGMLRWIQDYGHEHGYPRTILQWSRVMCENAVTAWTEHERSVA